MDDNEKQLMKVYVTAFLLTSLALCMVILCTGKARASELPSDEIIANAIYKAEGGTKTSHPYGILAHYKHTTPRQACINTIRHAKKDWNGKGNFINFLASRYAPIGAKNDPSNLNVNWIRNVNYYLKHHSKLRRG